MLSSSSLFDKLPARPPTPPRDVTDDVNEAIQFLDDSNEVEYALATEKPARPSNETPERSSTSSQAPTTGSSLVKRVDFSPWPSYAPTARTHLARFPSVNGAKSAHVVRAVQGKPLRSILKVTSETPPQTPDESDTKLSYFLPSDPPSFSKMLQSVTRQLANPSSASRSDAYLVLNGALKTYDGIPDRDAMAAQMDLLTKFVVRDMTWKDTDGKLDTNIVTQALKLTAAILFDAKLSQAVDDDFRTFLVDRSIAVLSSANMSKQIVKTHAYILASQRFTSHIVTAGRADRIVTALHTIEDRCTGNSVVATRLVAYQRLLDQQPTVMLTRIRDWVEHVFHGMLSSLKDIRTRAIETCTLAGLKLGEQPSASKAVRDLFETEVEEGQTYYDYMTLRLNNLIAEKENGLYVPQIWAAITLLFRNKRRTIEHWARIQTWLSLIQRCLNSSDLIVKYQANLAWNKLVFAVMPEMSVSPAFRSMLKVPIVVGLHKRKSDKNAKQLQAIALDSYNNLLHYALRPGLPWESIDNAWDLYVQAVLPDIIKTGPRGRHTACRILQGLFNPTEQYAVWNSNAANEEGPIRPEDLPRLEPKWLRSRFARITDVLEPILVGTMSAPKQATDTLDRTWFGLMTALREAGSQEIRSSTELKEAIATMIAMIRRLSQDQAVDKHMQSDGGDTCTRISMMLATVIERLGPAHFVEDIIARPQEDDNESAPTPSHRVSKHSRQLESPLLLLCRLFLGLPRFGGSVETQGAAMSAILTACLHSRPPAYSLHLLVRLLQSIKTSTATRIVPQAFAVSWKAIAGIAISTLQQPPIESPDKDSQQLGQTLRDALSILSEGVWKVLQDPTLFTPVAELYLAVLSSAKAQAGDGGIVLALMEPFARALNDADLGNSTRMRLELAMLNLKHAVWPADQAAMDRARNALWGIHPVAIANRSARFDPFEHVYVLIKSTLRDAYNSLNPGVVEEVGSLSLVVLSFLRGCPLKLLEGCLSRIQDSIALWIEDHERKVFLDSAESRILSSQVEDLWLAVVRLINTVPRKDSSTLQTLAPLLQAGFSSPRRAIVNATIDFWNGSFGKEESLDYPEAIKSVLKTLAQYVDISLPTFPAGSIQDEPASLPAFTDPQQEIEEVPTSYKPFSGKRAVTESPYFTANISPLAKSLQAPSSVPKSKGRLSKGKPKAKLRHDDSQIDFAPIESSPLRSAQDSQMLTDHQKEVRSRQIENAQLFPDFSSSPLAQSTALQANIPRKLDFTAAEKLVAEEVSTPTGLAEAHDGSDYLGSSPTPRAGEKADQVQDVFNDECGEEEVVMDPPSSPPRQTSEEPRQIESPVRGLAFDLDISTVVNPTLVQPTESEPTGLEQPPTLRPLRVQQALKQAKEDRSEQIHSERKQEEAVEAGSGELLLQTNEPVEADFSATVADKILQQEPGQQHIALDEPPLNAPSESVAHGIRRSSSPVHLSSSQANGGLQQSQPAGHSFASTNATNDEDVSRVEESFIEPAKIHNVASLVSGAAAERDSGRKRKRRADEPATSNKRKRQSPFKRFFSSFLGKSQETDDDDDIGDEIIVASSPPTRACQSTNAQPAASSAPKPEPSNRSEVDDDEPKAETQKRAEEGSAAPSEPEIHEPQTVEQPVKRGKGRSRKDKSASTTPKLIAPARKLKRKSSAVSTAGSQDRVVAQEDVVSTSVIEDTPAPAKARKLREDQYTKPARVAAAAEPQDSPSYIVPERRAASVLVSTPPREAKSHLEKRRTATDIRPSSPQTPRKVNEPTGSSAELQGDDSQTSGRPFLTPRSIIGRLRDMLGDVKSAILGAQEERELDDVLFELRREGHEAARRGREAA